MMLSDSFAIPFFESVDIFVEHLGYYVKVIVCSYKPNLNCHVSESIVSSEHFSKVAFRESKLQENILEKTIVLAYFCGYYRVVVVECKLCIVVVPKKIFFSLEFSLLPVFFQLEYKFLVIDVFGIIFLLLVLKGFKGASPVSV